MQRCALAIALAFNPDVLLLDGKQPNVCVFSVNDSDKKRGKNRPRRLTRNLQKRSKMISKSMRVFGSHTIHSKPSV